MEAVIFGGSSKLSSLLKIEIISMVVVTIICFVVVIVGVTFIFTSKDEITLAHRINKNEKGYLMVGFGVAIPTILSIILYFIMKHRKVF